MLGNQVFAAQSIPKFAPPQDNPSGYLNISDEDQTKRGALRLGTDDLSSPYQYQLEVLGNGMLSTNATVAQSLKVRGSTGVACTSDSQCAAGTQYCSYGYCRYNTLYVNSTNHNVCIGPCLGSNSAKLKVESGQLEAIGSTGTGISAVSGDSSAVSGVGAGTGTEGVATNGTGIGIWAVNATGTAVEGDNINYSYSPVYGLSSTGYGIYASNSNLLGLWSGYFEGRLESNLDVVGAKLVPEQLGGSLVRYTVGQQLGSYDLGAIDLVVRFYDGTYLWASDSSTLYKVRASDGFQVLSANLGSSTSAMLYDGQSLWVSLPEANQVRKINPADPFSGNSECSLPLTNPRGLAFDGTSYWATAYDSNDLGTLYKISSSCSQLAAVSLTASNFSIGKLIYNGKYLWALATDTDTNFGYLLNINPSSTESVSWQSLVGRNPADIFFDNYYYWVSNAGDNSLTRYYLRSTNVCASPHPDSGAYISCQYDTNCDSVSYSGGSVNLGGCFALPQQYGLFNTGTTPAGMVFDGTFIWLLNAGDSSLTRYNAADPSQTTTVGLGFVPTGIVFDGTYLWISSSSGVARHYSGTGFSSADLSGTLTLQDNSPLTTQSGSASVSGSGKVGSTFTAEGDLSAAGNSWPDAVDEDVIINPDDATWTQTGAMSGATVVNALIESSDGTILAGSGGGYIFRSTNRGDSWTRVSLPYARETISMLRASNGLYAGSIIASELYRSVDDGQSWSRIVSNFPGTIGVDAIFQASNGYMFVAGRAAFHGSGHVFRSTDSGTTWPLDLVVGSGGDTIYSNIIQLLNGTLMIGTSGGEIWSSDNNGDSWALLATLSPAVRVFSLLQAANGSLYAGAAGGNIFQSTNAGANWTQTALTGVTQVNSLEQGANGLLYAGVTAATNGRIYRSPADGSSWQQLTAIASHPTVKDLLQSTTNYWYAGAIGAAGNVFRSGFSPLPAGTYSCPEGHYLTDLVAGSDGKVYQINCHGL